MNFSRKLICVLIALNYDIRKRIVKLILNVIIIKGITTQIENRNRNSYNDGWSSEKSHSVITKR